MIGASIGRRAEADVAGMQPERRQAVENTSEPQAGNPPVCCFIGGFARAPRHAPAVIGGWY